MSHGAGTSGTFRVLTVASLQRLKMEALIPAPADCEVQSVIKFLNKQGIAPIEIHRTTLWSLFGNELWRIVASQLRNSAVAFRRLSWSACCSENSGGFQSNWHQSTKQRAWSQQRYHDDGEEFLDRIITGEETWVTHYPRSQAAVNVNWGYSGSPCKTIFKQTLSAGKVMCTVFWDRRDIEFLTTV